MPHLVSFSGRATDEHSKPISGTTGVTFAIYRDQYEGAPLWLETQNVQADKAGNFTAQLGASKSAGLPLDLFSSGEARWLGVRINGGEEQPRVLLLSVPYALKAADAETLGGVPLSAFVLAAPGNGGAAAAIASAPGIGSAALSPNAAVTGAGTVNAIPLWDTGSDIVSSVMTQTGSGTTARIGINTSTPSSTLDVKGASTFRGSVGLPAAGLATATVGKNSYPLNLTAAAFNSGTATSVTQTFRWQTEPVGNNTSTASGSLNLLYGSGSNQPAETGLKLSDKGLFTFAAGQKFPGTGTITSVGLSAPSADFSVSGSPVTGSGTLGLTWKKAPTSANTASAIVKRDASGGFSAGAIAATQLAVSGTIATGQLAASGTITAAGMGLGTTTPTERLDLGNDGNVVISAMPPDDNTPDLVGYNLIGRGAGGVPNKWSIYTAAIGGGFGVPANSFSIYQYPPNQDPGCCLQRFTIFPSAHGASVSTLVVDGEGHLGIGGAPYFPLYVHVPGVGYTAAGFEGFVYTWGDFDTEGCLMTAGTTVAGACVSDARLKKNIQPYPPVLNKLVQLQPVSYNFRADEFPQFHMGTSRTSGLIAQEVEKIFPDMVTTGEDGFRRVNYSQLPYLMLQAIRELKAENDSLREQVSDLAQLRKEVQRLAEVAEKNDGVNGKASASAAKK